MTEIVRERDVVVLVKGATTPVVVHPSLAQWAGGQGVTWADSSNDEFLVRASDGTYGGFLYEASTLDGNEYTALDGSASKYRYATLCAGSWVISTRTYEKYTYASRQSGPLVPITYHVGDRLRFSLRGLFSSEDEWLLSSDPRGSNQLFVGTVAQIPSASNKMFLTLQTSI